MTRLKAVAKPRSYTSKGATLGAWFTTQLTETESGRPAKYILFLPSTAKPNVPLPMLSFIMGAGQRGPNDSSVPDETLISTGNFGGMITSNAASIPYIIFMPMMMGGPDSLGQRWGRSWWMQAYLDAQSRYGLNIDPNKQHIAGYSYGAFTAIGLAYRYRKLFASLSIFDGVPTAFNMTMEEGGSGGGAGTSDLLAPASYPAVNAGDHTNDAAAWVALAAGMGDISMNYQHGGSSNAVNDPTTWHASFAGNGLTTPTLVSATTSPSPTYSATNRNIRVDYSSYDHGGLNGGQPYAWGTPWWTWLAGSSQVRSSYP